MTGASKIRHTHLERRAFVYVRQSGLAQVRNHTESTARQYGLAGEATRLGWEASRIVVIDEDLGISGRTASARAGYRELVGRVCLGEVGAILGLEVSRLARSSADLQRLLEFLQCERHVDHRQRWDLRPGELQRPVAAGAERDDVGGGAASAGRPPARGQAGGGRPWGSALPAPGRVCLRRRPSDRDGSGRRDPGGGPRSVRGLRGDGVGLWRGGRVRRAALSAAGVWRSLGGRDPVGSIDPRPGAERPRESGLRGGVRVRSIPFAAHPDTRWHDPDQADQPAAAGVGGADPRAPPGLHQLGDVPGEPRARGRALHAPRSASGTRGRALCQGIVRCGACGRGMATTYPAGKAAYDCSRTRSGHPKTPGCRSVLAAVIDGVVTQRLLQVMAPEEIALALAAADEVADRHARGRRALELRAERARDEAARAERAFHHCDPDNRLVARSLEQRWEAQLKELAEAERELACDTRKSPMPPREEIEALAQDLPRLWAAPTTSAKDRKRLVRSLIADVTVRSDPAGPRLGIGIRWRSGATEEVVTHRRESAAQSRRTSADVVELVGRLAPGRTDAEIAQALNAEGRTTGTGRPFDGAAVRWVRFAHGIRSRALLAPGELTVEQVATHLGISASVVYYWIGHGQLEARRGIAGRWGIPFSAEIERGCRERIASSSHLPAPAQTVLQET